MFLAKRTRIGIAQKSNFLGPEWAVTESLKLENDLSTCNPDYGGTVSELNSGLRRKPEPEFETFKEPWNRFQGMDFAWGAGTTTLFV